VGARYAVQVRACVMREVLTWSMAGGGGGAHTEGKAQTAVFAEVAFTHTARRRGAKKLKAVRRPLFAE
jgi:hypothetical protein